MQDDAVFELYKPLRNHLRQLSLMDSLGTVRAYVQHLQFNQSLPGDINVEPYFVNAKNKIEKKVYEWELDVLAKEIILNTDDSIKTKTLRNWNYFSGAINKLKDLENNIGKHYNEIMAKNVLLELYRISHRQFPWQTPPHKGWMTRYYKIFGISEIDKIIQGEIGLTTKELYTLGLAFTGVYLNYFSLDYPPDLQLVGIDKEKLDKFLEHFSCSMEAIKGDIKNCQSYDMDYAYSFNPLKVKPLIRTIHQGKDSLICPVPTFMFKRFTEGIYYELCKNPGFANPFGRSFQKYIGEVIEGANFNKKYNFFAESEYKVGKERKDTADWLVVDPDCNLFVECKTKKLRTQAKISLLNNAILEEDLDLMADFIVQLYKSIIDYEKNYYKNVKNNRKQIFPLIVTLEEWFAFGDAIILEIDNKVIKKLKNIGINEDMLHKMPYSICSAEDFERFMQVSQFVGINKIMTNKTNGEKRLWALQSVLFSDFNNELKNLKELFEEDYKQIYPDILSKS